MSDMIQGDDSTILKRLMITVGAFLVLTLVLITVANVLL